MPKVRGNPSEKWARRAGQSSQDYAEGVTSPRVDWKQATLAAAKNQELGVQAAIQDKRFEKGVNAAGSAKWQQKALQKGQQRFVQGVQESQGDYETGVSPYLKVIEATTLPPRYPKGDPRNIERVVALNKALRAAKSAR